MKLAKFLFVAALIAGSWSKSQATQPDVRLFDSYGWFSTSGSYAVEYWVDAFDPDGDLISLHVSAHDEAYDEWYDSWGTGNGAHLRAHGYGVTIDGYTTGRVWARDSQDTYYSEMEFSY